MASPIIIPGAGTNFSGVPNSTLNIVNAGVDRIYSNIFRTTVPESKPWLGYKTASSTNVDLVAALGVLGARIWTGSKKRTNMNGVTALIPLKPLERTIGINKWQMMGDALGVLSDQVTNLAAQAALYPDQGAANALQSGLQSSYQGFWQGTDYDYGELGNIYGDGLTFFSAAHKWPGTSVASQSNMVTGSLYDPLTWRQAYNQMVSFNNNAGLPLRVQPKCAVYAPNDSGDVLNGLTAKISAVDARPTITSTNNIPRVALDNVVTNFGISPCLLSTLNNDPGVAYLIGEVNGVKAVYEHWLNPLHLVPSIRPDSSNVFFDAEFLWSLEGYGRVLPHSWFQIVRIVDPNIAKYVT